MLLSSLKRAVPRLISSTEKKWKWIESILTKQLIPNKSRLRSHHPFPIRNIRFSDFSNVANISLLKSADVYPVSYPDVR